MNTLFYFPRLYESPKKRAFEEKTESALTWCRQVLDNPSPEVEAACRHLIHRLDDSKQAAHSDPFSFHILICLNKYKKIVVQ